MKKVSRFSLGIVASLIAMPQVASAKACYEMDLGYFKSKEEIFARKEGNELTFWQCHQFIFKDEDKPLQERKCERMSAHGTPKEIQENIELANRISRLQPIRKAVSMGNAVALGTASSAALMIPSAALGAYVGAGSAITDHLSSSEVQKRAAVGGAAGSLLAAPIALGNLTGAMYTAARVSNLRGATGYYASNILAVARIPSLFEDESTECKFEPGLTKIDSIDLQFGLGYITGARSGAKMELSLESILYQAFLEQTLIGTAAVAGPIMPVMMDFVGGTLPFVNTLKPGELDAVEMPKGVVDANRSAASADSK